MVCLSFLSILVIGPFSDTVPRTLPPFNEYETVSIKCVGKPSCVPDSDCIVEWKRGEGTSNTVQENKRIAIDAEGNTSFSCVCGKPLFIIFLPHLKDQYL